MRHLDGLMRRVAATGKTMGVLVCDLDRFKSVNDSYGHAAGDEVLKQFAQRATACMRNIDMLARMRRRGIHRLPARHRRPDGLAHRRTPGEEGGRDADAGRWRARIAQLTVTVSVGVASTSVEIPGEELIKMADAALYRAKEGGRNQAVADPAQPALSRDPHPPFGGFAIPARIVAKTRIRAT